MQEALLIEQTCLDDVKTAMEVAGSIEEQQSNKEKLNLAMTKIKEETADLLEKRRKINKYLEITLKPQLINLSSKIKAIESVADRKLEVRVSLK